jgi:hypothetical protein
VATAITGAAGAELDFAPVPERWSIRQILAHLADSEIVCADRLRRVIAEQNPTLIAFDQDAWAAHLNYAQRKISESLETFRRLRAENFELLKDLPEPVYERTGTHSERGVITLSQLVEGIAGHAERHARQLQDLRRLYKQTKASG